MDQVAIKALDVQPIQLMVIGMALLALAIVILAWMHSRSTDKLVGVMQAQVTTNSELTAATVKQTDALRREQDLREAQRAATDAVREAVKAHDDKSAGYVQALDTKADERQRALAEHIKVTTAQNLTDLIGATEGIVDKSTKQIVDALLQGFGTVRTNIEAAQTEYRQKMEEIGEQVADMQHKFIQAIRVDLGAKREEHTNLGGDGTPDPVVSTGPSGASAGGNGTGHSADSGGTTGD